MNDEPSWMGPHSLGASFSTRAGWSDASPCVPLSDGSGGDGRATFCDGLSSDEVIARHLKIEATRSPLEIFEARAAKFLQAHPPRHRRLHRPAQ